MQNEASSRTSGTSRVTWTSGDAAKGICDLLRQELASAQRTLASLHEAAQRELDRRHRRAVKTMMSRLQGQRVSHSAIANAPSSNSLAPSQCESPGSPASSRPEVTRGDECNIRNTDRCDLDEHLEVFNESKGAPLVLPDSIRDSQFQDKRHTGLSSIVIQCMPDDALSDSSSTARPETNGTKTEHGCEPQKCKERRLPSTNEDPTRLEDILASVNSSTMQKDDGEQDEDSLAVGPLFSVRPTMTNTQFEVLPVWNQTNNLTPGNRLGSKMTKRNRSFTYASFKTLENDDDPPSTSPAAVARMRRDCCSKMTVLHPNSTRRAIWDFMSLCLVSYDMVMIPLQLFDPPETTFTIFMEWTTRLFWTMDMPLSTITGFLTNDGGIEMRLRPIFIRYLRTWLVLDTAIVLVDWLELVMKETNSLEAFRMGKATRAFRIVRMVRLLRLIRIQQVVTVVTERICSERLVIVADIMKIMLVIMGVAHLLACVWYGIGNASDDIAHSWVIASQFNGTSLGDRYTMSLHWSLSQFTGGMDEVTPESLNERVYAIVVFIFAFVTASLFVGSLTSSMTQLQIIGSNQSQQLAILRRYLRQNQISNRLALRVQRNAKHALSEQQRFMPEGSVELLAVVSEPLRVEIHFEMYSVVFSQHPFFATYIEQCPQVMRKVCHLAMQNLIVSTGDVIFNAGETPSAPKMYFITSGTFKYTAMTNGETSMFQEGTWLAEATLWTNWMHRGMLMAVSDSRISLLDSKKFQHIVSEFDHSDFDPKLYAIEFVNGMNYDESSLTDFDMHIASQIKIQAEAKADGQKLWRHRMSLGSAPGLELATASQQSAMMAANTFSQRTSNPTPVALGET